MLNTFRKQDLKYNVINIDQICEIMMNARTIMMPTLFLYY